MSDLAEIEAIAGALLRKVAAADRRKLLRAVARDLGRGQSTRIAAQLQPDGTAFAPRKAKPAPKGKLRRKGSIKREAMFRKLRLSRNLKSGATDQEAWAGFSGRASMIARKHQEGQADRPAKNQPKVPYPARVLIGDTEADRQRMLDRVLAHLAD